MLNSYSIDLAHADHRQEIQDAVTAARRLSLLRQTGDSTQAARPTLLRRLLRALALRRSTAVHP